MTFRTSIVSLFLLSAIVSPLLAASGNVEKKEYVCMMQDMVLGKPGIPIQFEGRTYYGCCEMCRDKIKSDPLRYTKASDPVSGKGVDKASAFIYGLEGTTFILRVWQIEKPSLKILRNFSKGSRSEQKAFDSSLRVRVRS